MEGDNAARNRHDGFMKSTLIATLKNEGPFIWEWVAHHLLVGFDHIVIYQNDSDDGSRRLLSALAEAGIIQYFPNPAQMGAHQVRAYMRAAILPEYRDADWVMALDLDEFLVVKTGDGTLGALMEEVPEADAVLINWKRFGSSGKVELSTENVTSRFTLAEKDRTIRWELTPYKSLFRPSRYLRPGIHRPKLPDELHHSDRVRVNGSGLTSDQFEVKKYRANDPNARALAQINHYMVKDAQSFVLKSYRGSAHQYRRDIGKKYWMERNFNAKPDTHIARYQEGLKEVMDTLDFATGNQMRAITKQSYEANQRKFEEAMKEPHLAELHQFCLDNPGL